ncbi:MAG: hypothetical protein LBV50_01325 [Novosphingobium sp.]|jgi:hypothetical protein|nr:hypothetical protein [Novosphingobium sp.]
MTAAALAVAPHGAPLHAAAPGGAPAAPGYADLADLADSARLVVLAEVRKAAPVEAERAPGVRLGWGRFYMEARTRTLIAGNAPLGEAIRYLADMPLDERGKPPPMKNRQVLLFARATQGQAGDLQLAAPDAQVPWDAGTETRLRAILAALVAPDAPKKVTGVREAIHVPGNLAGEGETQFFLDTADQSAAAITVQHRPDGPAAWGVSFSEVAAAADNAPQRDTLPWYRLACFLPGRLPADADLSGTPENKAQAQADYRLVLDQLGPCIRSRVYKAP